MARQTKSESKLTEAADKATALLQELQSRLATPAPSIASARKLRRTWIGSFASILWPSRETSPTAALLNQIRDRVIDAVAERILESWERGDRRELGALENQVIDRVAERILERMAGR